MKLPAFAGATAPFAHLLGLARPAPAPAPAVATKPAAEDKKDDDRRDGESDDDYAKRKAKEKDEKEEAERAAAEEGGAEEDDDEEEMKGNSPVAEARRRERRRVAAILGSPHAAGRVQVAASLACLTALTRKEAIAVLETMPMVTEEKPAKSATERRNPTLGPGGEVAAGPQAVAQSWDSAFRKTGARK